MLWSHIFTGSTLSFHDAQLIEGNQDLLAPARLYLYLSNAVIGTTVPHCLRSVLDPSSTRLRSRLPLFSALTLVLPTASRRPSLLRELAVLHHTDAPVLLDSEYVGRQLPPPTHTILLSIAERAAIRWSGLYRTRQVLIREYMRIIMSLQYWQ